VFVNPDLIESAERDDDAGVTTVVLTTGNTLLVGDDGPTIVERVIAFRRRCGLAET